jgi:hypothetical protein
MSPSYLQGIVQVSDDERRAQLTHTQIQQAFEYGKRVQLQEEFENGQRQLTMIDQFLNTLDGRVRTQVEGSTAMHQRYPQMFH